MSTLIVTNLRPQSGSNFHLTGSTHITGDLVVSETVIARELRTELTQSVVLFQSGSSQFGDSVDDSHEFTGSIKTSGSLTLVGPLGITGFGNVSSSLAALTGSFSSSVQTRLTTNEIDIAALTGSFSSSVQTRLTTNEIDIAALTGSFSSSVHTRLTLEENNVDVLQSHVSNIHAYTASSDSEISALMASTGSQYAHVSGLLAATGSNYAHITNLNASTGSVYSHVTGLLSATSSYGLDSEVTALMGATSSYALGADLSTLDGMVTALKEATGSYASTGSNTFTDNQVVSASVLLTLQQLTGSMPTGIATGSLIVSGSPVQLYIYNGSGSGWNRV